MTAFDLRLWRCVSNTLSRSRVDRASRPSLVTKKSPGLRAAMQRLPGPRVSALSVLTQSISMDYHLSLFPPRLSHRSSRLKIEFLEELDLEFEKKRIEPCARPDFASHLRLH